MRLGNSKTNRKREDQVYGKCYRRVFDGKRGKGNGYLYFELDSGEPVTKDTDAGTGAGLLRSLAKVKIPPTYTNVVLCPDPRNDLVGQAVDGQGKLQYFYSEKHRAQSNREKNCNLIHFGQQIPHIMEDINDILERWTGGGSSRSSSRGRGDKDKLALHALAFRIMTLCHFRPGSQKNIRKNGTYGLTTIGPEHLEMNGSDVAQITFAGKKNQINSCVIQDPLTISFLKSLNQHRAKLGNPRSRVKLLDFAGDGPSVTPGSLNEFLQGYHPSITTKTWRTWFANLSYIEKLIDARVIPQTIRSRKTLSNNVIRTIAEELHHTLAVNKRNYLIPELEALFVRDPDQWLSMGKLYHDPKEFLLAFLGDYCSL